VPIHKVLIIEGEPVLRRELASSLTEAGFNVSDVPDYPQALDVFDALKPNIAIVDEVLPSGEGKGLCSLLHHRNIPVILLGTDSSGEATIRALEAGADFYFTKPAGHQELVARVKALLRRYYKEAPV